MIKLIYGTTNSGKIESMKSMLSELNIEIESLMDVDVDIPIIEEDGKTVLENARKKAVEYYRILKEPVFSADSALFFKDFSIEEQPNLKIRRQNGKELNDNEMIEYYSSIAKKKGGKLTAQYVNGICLILDEDNIFEYCGSDIASEEFYIIDKSHEKRVKGLPINSLSVEISSGKYYFDLDHVTKLNYKEGFVRFFNNSLKGFNGNG